MDIENKIGYEKEIDCMDGYGKLAGKVITIRFNDGRRNLKRVVVMSVERVNNNFAVLHVKNTEKAASKYGYLERFVTIDERISEIIVHGYSFEGDE